MRIFTVTMTPMNPPYDDAVKNMALGMARELQGHSFTFVSYPFSPGFSVPANVSLLMSPFQRPGKHSMTAAQKLFVLFNMFIRFKRTDIVHFFITPQAGISKALGFLFPRRAPKTVITLSSVYTLLKLNGDGFLPGLFFSDRTVVHSEYAKRTLLSKGVGNVTRIYPGVDTERFDEPNGVTAAAPAGGSRVIYPGAYKILNDSFSFSGFISMAENVLKERPDTIFVMACRIRTKEDKDLENAFKGMAEERKLAKSFLFLNTVEDMPSLMRECAAVIMPASSPMAGVLEIPMVLLEAAYMERPVIYPSFEPFDELTEKGIGSAVADMSADGYAKEVINVLTDKTAAGRMGKVSREAVKKDFSFRKMVEAYGELYASLKR